MKRLRQFIESIVFAGLKPNQPHSDTAGMRWLGPLKGLVERFLSGGARPLDPLYLSNRTAGQKMRSALLVATPIVLVAAVVVLALSRSADIKQQAELSSAEVAKRILPDLSRDIKIDTNRDVVVLDAAVERGTPLAIAGSVQNNTSRVIRSAEIVFDVTNDVGSQVGAVATKVRDLPPMSATKFRFAIKQTDAAFVLVREVHPE